MNDFKFLLVYASESATPLSDFSLTFTTQMAALYRPDGKERVLEMHYTDLQKSYQILLGREGSQVITDGFRTYTTKIETPVSVWQAIARGEIKGEEALFQQQYRVLGDFGLMIQWQNLFGGAASNQAKAAPENNRSSNMLTFLLPWLAIWICVSIHPQWGGVIGTAVASLTPLMWFRFKQVPVEMIGVPLATGLALAAAQGVPSRLIVPLSYLVFGLIWFLSAFMKTPLTAYYSQKDYGGRQALDNPLFMRTNRILTLAWGALYLVTPVWTYALMGLPVAPYIGLINTIIPILMGLFTAWFVKWYPAHWGRSFSRPG